MRAWRAVTRQGLWTLMVITTVLWLSAKPSMASLGIAPLRSFAQLAGLLGVTALAWNFVLASRFRVLDRAFNGLDRAYAAHRRTGKMAFALMLAHPLAMVVEALPSWSTARWYLWPGPDWSLNWGLFALWGFALLIVLTLFVRMPYHLWKMTHRLMGLPFAAIALHVAMVPSDVAVFMPLRAWILGLVLIGLACYVYKTFLYRWLGPRYRYTVAETRQRGTIAEISLVPSGNRMPFEPGQFVFISVRDRRIGTESHPFTISSAPDDPALRLSVKASGDHTSRFSGIAAGTEVLVHGPYGRFGEFAAVPDAETVWIAGGIGVTPFLSLLRSLRPGHGARVSFYYSTRNRAESPYDEEIGEMIARTPGVRFERVFTDEGGMLTAEAVARRTGGIEGKRFFICGPMAMMRALSDGLRALGVARHDIVFEDFSLR